MAITSRDHLGLEDSMGQMGDQDTMCVAVGKDVEEGKSILKWAVRNSKGRRICLIHVHTPPKLIDHPLGPTKIPAKHVNDRLVRKCKERERLNMHKILHDYDQICKEMKVDANFIEIETEIIEEGIVEFITQHKIKWLVMGAAAEKHYNSRMKGHLRSRKAKYVCKEAPVSCFIQFICMDNLIHTRKDIRNEEPAGSSRIELDAALLRPSTPSSSDCSSIYTTPRSCFLEGYPPMNYVIGSSSTGDLSFTAQEELIHRRENGTAEVNKTREFEKMKNQINQVRKELQNVQDDQTSLKNQIAKLQEERDNAMTEVEKLRKKVGEYLNGNMHDKLQLHEFSHSQIKEATQNFDKSLKIGEGGYGKVYRGRMLQTDVAIKTLQSRNDQGISEFHAEVRALRQLRHPNLVKLIGYCQEEFALIYEYLPQGSLLDRLKCRDGTPPLSWKTRFCIIVELCSVLTYLHSREPHIIVHGDLKPSNILLGANFVSKLSDFGISRVLCHEHCSNSNTTVVCRITKPIKGSKGYIDPVLLTTGELTRKVDVYSFGIILLELLTNRSPSSVKLALEVKSALRDGNLGAILARGWPMYIAEVLAEWALKCCDMNRESRPKIEVVLKVLEPLRASFLASSSSA